MLLFSLPLLFNLFCAWFQCELAVQAPYFRPGRANPFLQPVVLKSPPVQRTREGRSFFKTGEENIIVKTESGFIQGFPMMVTSSRRIFAFTGVPYGDPPKRFSSPKRRTPWKGIWQGTNPSPMCIQSSPATAHMINGQEDCLFVDIYTSSLNVKRKLPVILWFPAGGFVFGRSRQYGPAKFLREDVVLIIVNIRMGILGFASTGDEAALGNWGIRDQLLAVEWVYANVKQFGGDPEKIVVGGISSAGVQSGLTIFANHQAKNYVKGIISLSGVPFTNYGLDSVGRVKANTELIARRVGCPSKTESVEASRRMIECLRKTNPYTIAIADSLAVVSMPPIGYLPGPTLEPNVSSAIFPELPEDLYKKSMVPAVPWIMSYGKKETRIMAIITATISLLNPPSQYRSVGQNMLQLFLAQSSHLERLPDRAEIGRKVDEISQFYFGNDATPWTPRKLAKWTDLIADSFINSPLWRAVKHHHKIAPSYVYKYEHNSVNINPLANLIMNQMALDGTVHASDTLFLFNSSTIAAPQGLQPDIEEAAKNIINMFVNFANSGKPLFRSASGKLEDVWRPVTKMGDPVALKVGLVKEIQMIRDPLVGSRRYTIWEELKY